MLRRLGFPQVRQSKTVLDSGFQAVDSGFQVLDSIRYTTDTSLLLNNFYHLREASASLAAAISAFWMLQEENEGYLS